MLFPKNCGSILRIVTKVRRGNPPRLGITRRIMEREKLIEILNFITTVECSDEQKKTLLEMAANTITVDKLSGLVGNNDGKETTQDKASENKVGIVKFTKKESNS